MKHLVLINRLLLGLVVLVAGLMKLFVIKPSNVAGMLAGFGFPIAMFFAWLLLVAEILSGAFILANWQLKYAASVAAIVLIVAAFTAWWADWVNMLVHLTLASSYLLIGWKDHK